MRRFSQFACIDWSGAKSRWHSGIALALCDVGSATPMLIAPAERHWTRAAILDWLSSVAKDQDDMLIGMDLSFALPFSDAGAYFPGWPESPPDAKALWGLVDRLSQPDAHLSASSFVANPEIARHFRQQRNCGDRFGTGRGRLRVCEANGQALIEGINPYSCFNLVGAAQVGKSSLTGMRLLHRLEGAIPIWPFDPLPQKGPVIVEIYTSIAARASGVLPKGKSKIVDGALLDAALAQFGAAPHRPMAHYSDHATDALLTSAWLRHVSGHGGIWSPQLMTAPIAQTEGWTFGVL